jgi:hypothetical protein
MVRRALDQANVSLLTPASWTQVGLDLAKNVEVDLQWSVAFCSLLGLGKGKGHNVYVLECVLAPANSFCLFIVNSNKVYQLSCANWIAFE